MKREIKFLAGFEGKLVPVASLVFPQMYSASSEVAVGLGEAPLYQFTGLKTEKGEEVYEGHVIRDSSYNGEEPDIFIGEVKWNQEEGRWEVYDRVTDETLYGSDIFPCDEIIGHVYTDEYGMGTDNKNEQQ